MGFKQDLDFGIIYEKKAIEYYKNLGYDIKHIHGYHKEYDFEITKDEKTEYVEVKADRITHKTGNIAIEYLCNYKPSGISTTTSHYYNYFVIKPNDEFDLYVIPTQDIRDLIESKEYTKILKLGKNGRNEVYLFKKEVFKNYLIDM